MANRRMIHKEVFFSDKFTDLPTTTRLLYVYLNLEADDDGFFTGTKQAMFLSEATKDDLKKLIDDGFIIKFDSDVYAIKHWRVMNTLQNDRYTPTIYVEEFAKLKPISNEKGANKIYEFVCIQDGYKTETQLNQNQGKQLSQNQGKQLSINNLGKNNFDDTDAQKNDNSNFTTFFQDKRNEAVKELFKEKVGALRSVEDYNLLRELIEAYGTEYVNMCIEKTADNEGKSVQYLEKVCESENGKI